MRLKTLQPVTFDMWIAQAKKFTNGNTRLINTTIPSSIGVDGVAEIIVDIKKPLHQGFDAVITYRQNYTTDSLVDGETISINQYVDVVKYKRSLPYNESNIMVSQIEPTIDSSVLGLDRFKEIIVQAVLQDAIANATFGGLLAEDYEVIVE